VDKSPFLYSDNYNYRAVHVECLKRQVKLGEFFADFFGFSPFTNTPTHQRKSIIANI